MKLKSNLASHLQTLHGLCTPTCPAETIFSPLVCANKPTGLSLYAVQPVFVTIDTVRTRLERCTKSQRTPLGNIISEYIISHFSEIMTNPTAALPKVSAMVYWKLTGARSVLRRLNYSATQDIPGLSWNPKVQYRIQERWSQVTLPTYTFQHINIHLVLPLPPDLNERQHHDIKIANRCFENVA
jgi:hypothetical protein